MKRKIIFEEILTRVLEKLNEAAFCSAGEAGAAWGDPNYHPDFQNHGFWRHRRKHKAKSHSPALYKHLNGKPKNPKGYRHDMIEDDLELAEKYPEIDYSDKKKKPVNVWDFFSDTIKYDDPVKTASEKLSLAVRDAFKIPKQKRI